MELPVEKFGKSKSSKDGYYCYCKDCSKKYREENKERDKQRYLQNRESILAYKKEYAKKNADKIRENQKSYRESHREELSLKQKNRQKQNKEKYYYTKHKLSGRYSTYKTNATKRGLQFDLTLEQFDEITSKPCYYCGDFDYYKDMKYTGVDRMNSENGYFLENCVPCCNVCNTMKSNRITVDFLDKIKKIYNLHIKE
jgi:hypothetical protein